MSEEPVYTFVKGQGWVVQQYRQLTFTVEGVTITLVERPPEFGEHFWTGPNPIEVLADALKDSYWRNIYIKRTHRNATPVRTGDLDPYYMKQYMTVIFHD